MKTPVQLWLPLFYRSPFDGSFSRDLQRAQDELKYEQRIYLLPDAKEVMHLNAHFLDSPISYRICIVPSEEFNVIDIIHINEAKNYFPSESESIPDEWNCKIPENLFKLFIDSQFGIFLSKKKIEIFIPEVNGDELNFIVRTFHTIPSPIIPNDKFENDGTFELRYPPGGKKFPSIISPESEMRDSYKPAKWMKNPIKYLADIQSKSPEIPPEKLPKDFPLSIDEDGKEGIGICYGYSSQPLRGMFPLGGGLDFAHQKAIMSNVIKSSIEEQKIKEIQKWIHKFSTKATTSYGQAWLCPLISSNRAIESILVEARDKGFIDKKVKNIDDLCSSNFLDEKTECIRIFSWIGYFWWEMSQILPSRTIKFCQNCGKVMTGRSDKQFCNETDDVTCFNSRRALDKQKQRKRKQNK